MSDKLHTFQADRKYDVQYGILIHDINHTKKT